MESSEDFDDDDTPRAVLAKPKDKRAERAVLAKAKEKRAERSQFEALSPLNGYAETFSIFAGETLALRLGRKPGSLFWWRRAYVKQIDVRDAVSGATIATIRPQGKIRVPEQLPASHRDEGAAYRARVTLDTAGWPVALYECVVSDSMGGRSRDIFVNVKPGTFDDHDLVCVLPFFTWHAYNFVGGGSFYSRGQGPVRRVSTQRPLSRKGDNAVDASLVFLHAFAGAGLRYCCIDSSDLHRGLLPEGRVPVMALLTHDEYWSAEMRSQVNRHLRRRGALLVAAGNVCWWEIGVEDANLSVDKTPGPNLAQWHRRGVPEERTFLSSFRFGGYALGHAPRKEWLAPRVAHLSQDEIRAAGALTVVQPSHPLFEGVRLDPENTFGADVPIVYREVDGIPLKTDGTVDRDWYHADDIDPQIIATGLVASSNRYDPIERVGVVAEARVRRGYVLHLGSFGWSRGLVQKNEMVKRVVLNAVRRCLSMARTDGRART